MRKLSLFFLLLTFSSQSVAGRRTVGSRKRLRKEQPSSTIVLTVSVDNRVRVQNAEPGSQDGSLQYCSVKFTTIRINFTDVTVQVNLPKGYYIFKIGNVVRKVVIK